MQYLVLATLSSTLLLSTPNLGYAGEAAPQVRVELGDIDISTEQGADRALRRILQAALQLCDTRVGPQPLHERSAARACVNETMARTVVDMANSTVSSRFASARLAASDQQRSNF